MLSNLRGEPDPAERLGLPSFVDFVTAFIASYTVRRAGSSAISVFPFFCMILELKHSVENQLRIVHFLSKNTINVPFPIPQL